MLHVATFIIFSQSFYGVSYCHCKYCTKCTEALVCLKGIVLYALNADGMVVFDMAWCVSLNPEVCTRSVRSNNTGLVHCKD